MYRSFSLSALLACLRHAKENALAYMTCAPRAETPHVARSWRRRGFGSTLPYLRTTRWRPWTAVNFGLVLSALLLGALGLP